MRPTGLRIATLLLSALTLGLSFAHVLEMPQKLTWDATLWVTVEHSLYRYFGVVGGPLEVAAVVTAVVLAVLSARRGLPADGSRVAAVLFVLGLAEWAAVVQTTNVQIGQWSVGAVPADWARWRDQWEWGHAGHFSLWLAGFVVLLVGSVRGAAAAADSDSDSDSELVHDGGGGRP